MKRLLPIAFAALTVFLLVLGLAGSGRAASASTPEGTVAQFLGHVKAADYAGAYAMISASSNADRSQFTRDWTGQNGSLKTLSALENYEIRSLHQSDQDAEVRANLRYSTAVGALYETKDFKLIREGESWKIFYPVAPPESLPPQVVSDTYLRWDVVHGNSGDDWGAQNVDAPRVRIISMNPVENEGHLILVGEVVNEDTVPGFVSINATLIGKDGSTLGEESSFDKIAHTLLPKEVSPYRVDFPGIRLDQVKNVRMEPASILVSASADPVIAVVQQRMEKDSRGREVLSGELVNQSGEVVNIPQVLATYYDNSGRVIWVSDGYVNQALLPLQPVPFSVDVSSDLAASVHSYRVIVNHFSLNERL